MRIWPLIFANLMMLRLLGLSLLMSRPAWSAQKDGIRLRWLAQRQIFRSTLAESGLYSEGPILIVVYNSVCQIAACFYSRMLLHPNCSRSVHIADSAVAVNVCTLPRGWKLDGLLFPLPA